MVELSELCLAIVDCEHKTAPKSEEGYPLIRTTDIGRGRLDLSKVQRVDADAYEEWTRRAIPQPGDLILAREAPVGNVAIVTSDLEPVLGQRTVLIRPDLDRVDPDYLTYRLLAYDLQHWMNGVANGATVPHLNMEDIRSLPIPALPPLEEQRAIGSALAAFDDLIENNRRRIEILEEMARLIYREWFVHFRFPGHEDVELVDSDLGPIPEGWEVSSLESLQSATPNAIAAGPFGSKLGRKDYVDEPGVPVIRGANLRLGGGFVDEGFVYVSSEKAESLTSSFARPGDVVVTQRGTLGQVGLIPESARFDEYVLSQSQMKFTADVERVDALVIYMQLATPEGTRRIQDIATGSGVPHINLTMFREMKCLAPPRSIQHEFTAAVGSMERLRNCLDRQNRTLAEARELILPRLISGELDVSDLDLDLEPVA